ncbi:recombinase family protein [uncultured Roseovarius sp.]|uniref:recombinase family protein n=1 Tax=uncultured Roseovarius sp. TaxID=293344 RepID=UPI002603B1C5|nr:recombinase family protein [uncultured Roseovarius sp.]
MRRIRCAIYTRKSTEEGLEQEFNSLNAQREACEAYIASQKHEGWELIDRAYDDGVISGGHLDRPALQRLMQDVDYKQVDQIVVCKINRLMRSLADFAKLVDRLDAAEASFVSVTQCFNTATSMGRLTLNVLLSFAQFGHEVTAERIRDKIAASKRKGLWMGGNVPLGYDADGQTLKINTEEAEAVATIYDLYETHGASNIVAEEAAKSGIRSRKRRTKTGDCRGGNVLSRGHIHYILTSPIYAGRIPHKGKTYAGQHPAIIDPARWQCIQDQLLARSPAPGSQATRKTRASPLLGKLFDENGARLSPSHSRKRARRYRYYISRGYVTGCKDRLKGRGWRLPADPLEQVVAQAIRNYLSSSEMAALVPNAQVETLKRLHNLQDAEQN